MTSSTLSEPRDSKDSKPPLSIRPEFASAISGAVLELQTILSSIRHTYSSANRYIGGISQEVKVSTQASAFELQRFAKEALAEVRSYGDAKPTDVALQAFETVVRSLVVDNGPTPQVGATPSGSMEIQWLVDGILVSALFDDSGECYLLAVTDSNEVLVDAEFPPGPVPDALETQVADVLQTMGARIKSRPSSWSARGDWR